MPLVLLNGTYYVSMNISLVFHYQVNHWKITAVELTLPCLPWNGMVLAISLTDTFMAIIWLKDQIVKEIWNHIMLNFSVLPLAETWPEFRVHKNYCSLRIDLHSWVVNTKYLGSLKSLSFWKSNFYKILTFHCLPREMVSERLLKHFAKKEREREGNKDIYFVFY